MRALINTQYMPEIPLIACSTSTELRFTYLLDHVGQLASANLTEEGKRDII